MDFGDSAAPTADWREGWLREWSLGTTHPPYERGRRPDQLKQALPAPDKSRGKVRVHCGDPAGPVGDSRGDDVVDTTQLRALRLGPEIHVLLRSLVLNRNLVPPDAVFLNFTTELPSELAHVLEDMQRAGQAWCAWRDEHQAYAVSAESDEALSTMLGRPVLRLSHHDELGAIVGATCWLESEPDTWVPCDLG
jgi:hypothetical protein